MYRTRFAVRERRSAVDVPSIAPWSSFEDKDSGNIPVTSLKNNGITSTGMKMPDKNIIGIMKSIDARSAVLSVFEKQAITSPRNTNVNIVITLTRAIGIMFATLIFMPKNTTPINKMKGT